MGVEILVFLSLLIIVSLPFAALGAILRSILTPAVPVAFWLLVIALQNHGLLPGQTHLGTALFAGIVGAIFAGAGIVLRSRLERNAAST